MVLGMGEIDRFLEQWEMDVPGVHRRLILAPTPRERERDGTPSDSWPRAGAPRTPPEPCAGTLIPSDDGWPPSARAARRL